MKYVMIALVVSIIIQIKNKVGFKQVFKKMHCKLSQFLNCFIEAKSWFFFLKKNIMQTILKNLNFEIIISHLHFMAFICLIFNSISLGWYKTFKIQLSSCLPGTAGGTVLLRARIVALALSSLENFLGQLIPAVTMLGFSNVPSR